MKKIKLDAFMDFRMLSSLTFSPDGGKLAYVLTGIDREKKEYVSKLRLRAGEDDRPMVSDGKIGEFLFEDDDHILFSTDRRDEKKKDPDAKEKEATTVLYRLPLTGGEAENPYTLLNLTFGNIWVALCYIVWFIAIFLHMGHGFWSMFQTVGWSNTIWMKRTKVIGIIVAAVIVLMFISVVCNAYLQANGLIG